MYSIFNTVILRALLPRNTRMVTTTSILLVATILATFALSQAQGLEEDTMLPRQRRYVDENFHRRYNHLKREYSGNPLMFDFFKYFLRNRGQREKRQIDYSFPNSNGFGSGYTTYNQPRPVPSPIRPTSVRQNPKTKKRETTRRTKPFRPQMVFF